MPQEVKEAKLSRGDKEMKIGYLFIFSFNKRVSV